MSIDICLLINDMYNMIENDRIESRDPTTKEGLIWTKKYINEVLLFSPIIKDK